MDDTTPTSRSRKIIKIGEEAFVLFQEVLGRTAVLS